MFVDVDDVLLLLCRCSLIVVCHPDQPRAHQNGDRHERASDNSGKAEESVVGTVDEQADERVYDEGQPSDQRRYRDTVTDLVRVVDGPPDQHHAGVDDDGDEKDAYKCSRAPIGTRHPAEKRYADPNESGDEQRAAAYPDTHDRTSLLGLGSLNCEGRSEHPKALNERSLL